MRAALPVGGDGHSQPWRRSGRSPSCECCAGCRHPSFDATEDSLLEWRTTARETFTDALLMPALPALRAAAVGSVEVARSYEHDGVRIEELSWQLPYGPRTQALFLTPTGVVEPGSLPALLALHCHGGQKVFGLEKITVRKRPLALTVRSKPVLANIVVCLRYRNAAVFCLQVTDQPQHPAMAQHQATYYGGRAWANEMARRGYAVLVHDAFPFGAFSFTNSLEKN